MSSFRKQKLVSVCAIEESAETPKFVYYTSASKKTNLSNKIKSPINDHNLVMMEVYPEMEVNGIGEYLTTPCSKLIFLTLGCEKNSVAENIRYQFDLEYRYVEIVDFSGYIGSMRAAFDLIKKFPKCREVVFIMADSNSLFPHETEDSFEGLQQYHGVESLKILHEFSIVEKQTVDVQKHKWRLDEILEGCRMCFPNLKKLEVHIYGTGANFDKINKFITARPYLNNRYSVDITNGKLKTKLKQLSKSSHQRALPSAPSLSGSLVKAPHNMEVAKGPVIPVDLSRVKKERSPPETEERSLTLHPKFNMEYVAPVCTSTSSTQGTSYEVFSTGCGNDGRTMHGTDPSFAYSNNQRTSHTAVKEIIWKEDANKVVDETLSIPVHEIHLPISDSRRAIVVRTHVPVGSNGSTNSSISGATDEVFTRLQARNPSPPPLSDQNPVVSMVPSEENLVIDLSVSGSKACATSIALNEVSINRPRAPPSPPQISKIGGSEEHRKNRSQHSGPRDPRLSRWDSPSPSPERHFSHSRSSSSRRLSDSRSPDLRKRHRRSRSTNPRRYRSRSRSSPRRYRSRSRSSSPRGYRSRSRSSSPRRYRSRSRSTNSRTPRQGSSHSRSPSSRRGGGHNFCKPRYNGSPSHSRRSRSRSYSPSRKDYSYRDTSRYSNYRGYRGSSQYNPAIRRSRGRGIRGPRFRGRGRGRGGRGFKASNYCIQDYESRNQEDENWEEDAPEIPSQGPYFDSAT